MSTKWTEEEIKYLTDNYCQESFTKIAETLGKTLASVQHKSSRLGLSSKRRLWTLEEDNFLRDNYATYSVQKCAELLNRSKDSIKIRARKVLGLTSLTRETSSIKILNNWLLENTDIVLLEEYTSNNINLLVKHLTCGHTWYSNLANLKRSRKQGNTGCPNCASNRNYSAIAIEWLNSFNNPNIQHAENGGEVLIAGVKVDGYDHTSNTVYEFHGDIFHGNLDLFSPEDRCNPFDLSVTAEELWQKTYNRMKDLSKVATVIYIWENDYKQGKTYEVF